jgi:hypothetical protein
MLTLFHDWIKRCRAVVLGPMSSLVGFFVQQILESWFLPNVDILSSASFGELLRFGGGVGHGK